MLTHIFSQIHNAWADAAADAADGMGARANATRARRKGLGHTMLNVPGLGHFK